MVYTHLPANLFLVLAALMPTAPLSIACLLLRMAVSQMDVPARQAFVMAVVPPEERTAAASVTNVPRSLAAGPRAAAGRGAAADDQLRLAAGHRRHAEGGLRRRAAAAVPGRGPAGGGGQVAADAIAAMCFFAPATRRLMSFLNAALSAWRPFTTVLQ